MRFTYILLSVALVSAAVFSPVHSSGAHEDISDYGPIDRDSGWLLTADRLYITRDLGASWQTVTPALLPGELLLAAHFLATGEGWAALGRTAAGDRSEFRLARTHDGGATWSYAPLALFAEGDPDPTIARLKLEFASSTDGILRVRHISSSNFEHWSEWRTGDGGETWQRQAMAAPAADASSVDFIDSLVGWKLEREGKCSERVSSRVCRQVVTLGATDDGGRTWRAMPLPQEIVTEREFTALARADAGAASISSRTLAVSGQGFDKCEVASVAEFSDWRANSPYSASNLYIGGSKRYCANSALNADYLRYIASMGWTFIPTWVGPQSPCYAGGNGGISRDPAVAQSQGWAEAQAAADTALRLGLTEPDGTGSIVYYDMEYYNTSDGSCNAAVQAFITGWVNGLHGRGNLAGVYGTGSTLKLLANLSPPPNAIWAAHWIYDSYTPAASVWNVYSLSNGLWVNQQRLRQYTGGHNETWGSSTLNIDSNVLDGLVAVMQPVATPTSTPTRIPFTPTTWHYLPLIIR